MDYLNSKDNRPGIVVAPTAYGKSYLISAVANDFDGPVLVLQPNSVLLEQNLEKLRLLGGDATVYSASLDTKEASELTYATLKSLKGKAHIFKSLGVKTVLVDECDYGYSAKTGSEFQNFLKDLKPTKLVGLTATPFNLVTSRNRVGDNISKLVMLDRIRPKIFKHYIDVVQIQEIIAQGRWSELVYIKHDFDTGLLEFNTSGSDYSDESVKKAVEANGVNNKIYLRVKELLKDKSKNILVFVDSLENGEKFASLFPDSEFLSSKTSKKDRKRILKNFRDPNHKTRVVFNYGILTTGFDYPALNHIILGRPTNSLRLYYQIIGRGVRLFTGKPCCYFEDLCGNVDKFGYVEDLTIEDFPGHGWAAFSGDVLLTGVPLDAPVKKTKLTMNEKFEDGMKFWYGKYKDTPVRQVGKGYLIYQAEWIDSLPSPSEKLMNLRSLIKSLVGV